MIRKINIFAILILMVFSTCAFAGFSVKEEIEMGKETRDQMVKKYPATTHHEKQKKLEEMGNKLTKYCERHDFEYEYHLIDMGKDGPNAFAIPGGFVFFDEALWDVMDDSERLGILGHEIIHVDRKHSLKQYEKNLWTSVGLAILVGVTKAGDVGELAAGLAQLVMANNYSIKDEKEADIKGTDLLIKAGLDPCGVLNSMKMLYRMDTGSTNGVPDFLLDHPKTKERIKYLTKYLEDKDIEIVEKPVNYIYPDDMIGKIKEVEYKNKKYKKLTCTLNEGVEVREGELVYIDRFVWDSKYQNLIPVSFCSAEISKIYDDGVCELKFKEVFSKDKDQISDEDVVALSKIALENKSK